MPFARVASFINHRLRQRSNCDERSAANVLGTRTYVNVPRVNAEYEAIFVKLYCCKKGERKVVFVFVSDYITGPRTIQ